MSRSFFQIISNSFSSSSSKKLFHQILTSKYHLQAKYEPIELKRILSDKNGKELFKRQLEQSERPLGNNTSQIAKENHLNMTLFKVLKKLSMFHHLVIYYHEFTELIQTIDLDCLIQNVDSCWFLDCVIKPYSCFIKRYCLGIELYQKLRAMPHGNKDSIFQCMCYAINILKSLFNVISRLASIGRYYRQKSPTTVDYFVQLMAYHSQLIYQGFRACISQIISFSKEHLSKKQDQIIFKQILSNDLPWINEQMKKLFLDKYFYPYGKGYGVKLYRFEDQSQCQIQVINGILNDHEKTARETEAKMFEETLFPTNLAAKYSHQDLQKSFSFSLSKLEHLRKQNKHLPNPQKDRNPLNTNLNNTLPFLKGNNIRSQQNKTKNKKSLNMTSLQNINYQQQVVEDIQEGQE